MFAEGFTKTAYKPMVAGALIGGALGAGVGFGKSTGKNKKDKTHQRIKNVLNAGLGGALLGGAYGGALGSRISRVKAETYRNYYRRSGGYGSPAKSLVDTHEKALKTLGLTGKEKTKSEFMKSFKAAAMRHHPDRGGDPEKMKEINSAKEHLEQSGWLKKLKEN